MLENQNFVWTGGDEIKGLNWVTKNKNPLKLKKMDYPVSLFFIINEGLRYGSDNYGFNGSSFNNHRFNFKFQYHFNKNINFKILKIK